MEASGKPSKHIIVTKQSIANKKVLLDWGIMCGNLPEEMEDYQGQVCEGAEEGEEEKKWRSWPSICPCLVFV